jgi:hypothetical protein
MAIPRQCDDDTPQVLATFQDRKTTNHAGQGAHRGSDSS